ncbi:MAG: Tex-like N-terminal domain-containing protein, partial [Saprospiraceae bacterium]
METEIIGDVVKKLNLRFAQVKNVIELLAQGSTIPFIARYRKELTGSLDEVQIRDIQKSYQDLLDLKERKLFVLKTIEEQGQLTQELEHKILHAID